MKGVPPGPVRFTCCGDGNCCRHAIPLVEVDDVRRLMAEVGLHPREFVRLYAAGDMGDLVAREGQEAWLETTQGARVMGLRRRADQCLFLDGDNRCRVYPSRPLNCRIYPIDYLYSDNGTGIRVRRQPWCGGRHVGELDRRELLGLARRYNAASTRTERLVARWNRETAGAAKPTEFLDFLAEHLNGRR